MGHSELLDNFTVTQALKTGRDLAQMETAVDKKIEEFNQKSNYLQMKK